MPFRFLAKLPPLTAMAIVYASMCVFQLGVYCGVWLDQVRRCSLNTYPLPFIDDRVLDVLGQPLSFAVIAGTGLVHALLLHHGTLGVRSVRTMALAYIAYFYLVFISTTFARHAFGFRIAQP